MFLGPFQNTLFRIIFWDFSVSHARGDLVMNQYLPNNGADEKPIR